MNLEEIIEMLKELNEDYIEVENSSIGLSPYILTSDGYNIRIEFMGHLIWNSNEDERDFIEDKNEYEPLKDFILRQTKDIMLVLNNGERI